MRTDLQIKSIECNEDKTHLTKVILQRSAAITSKTYQKIMPPSKESTLLILRRYNIYTDNKKIEISHNLNLWRDKIARELDESYEYIMDNNVLITLLKRLPINSSEVINCYNPVPEIIRKYSNDISKIINYEKDDG